MNHWLLKTEPGDYNYDHLLAAGVDVWSGVANPLALKHLRAMLAGDLCFIYHTGNEKAVVGIAEVIKAHYADPNGDNEKQIVVDIKAQQRLHHPVTLATIKSDPAFAGWELVRVPRLSVMPVPKPMWDDVMKRSK